MSGKTSISWADATWNPVRGCSRVSEGCRHCYAERQAARNLPAMRSPKTGKAFAQNTPHGPRWTGKVEMIESALAWPLHRKRPLRIFVNSMSDLFHESLGNVEVARIFAAMAASPQHTFYVLTKRPARMLRWFEWLRIAAEENAAEIGGTPTSPIESAVLAEFGFADGGRGAVDEYRRAFRSPHPLPNVWVGVSCEDRAMADERIPLLLATPAAHRFVSLEPLLGPIRLDELPLPEKLSQYGPGLSISALDSPDHEHCHNVHPALDAVILGGESGPNARPCDVSSIRSIVRQCTAAGVGVMVKQLGARAFSPNPGAYGCEWCYDHRHAGRGGCPKCAGLQLTASGADPSEWPEDLRPYAARVM
jgi:protein gp37